MIIVVIIMFNEYNDIEYDDDERDVEYGDGLDDGKD
jgi:hypothetical protein